MRIQNRFRIVTFANDEPQRFHNTEKCDPNHVSNPHHWKEYKTFALPALLRTRILKTGSEQALQDFKYKGSNFLTQKPLQNIPRKFLQE